MLDNLRMRTFIKTPNEEGWLHHDIEVKTMHTQVVNVWFCFSKPFEASICFRVKYIWSMTNGDNGAITIASMLSVS